MSIPPRYFPESFEDDVFVDYIRGPLSPKHFHFHENHCEICLVTSGKFCYIFEDHRFVLNPYDMVFIRNPVEHKIVSFESDSKPECYVLNFNANLFSENAADYVLLYNIFSIENLTVPTEDIHNIYSLFTNLVVESDYPTPFSKNILKNHVYNLLALLYRLTHNLTAQCQFPTVSVVESATKFIANNYSRDISVEDISKFCNTNMVHLARVFKKVVGMTIIKYLTNIRIHHACSLLLETDKSITEISELSGFNSHQRFCEVFKTIKGVSPRDFRKNSLD